MLLHCNNEMLLPGNALYRRKKLGYEGASHDGDIHTASNNKRLWAKLLDCNESEEKVQVLESPLLFRLLLFIAIGASILVYINVGRSQYIHRFVCEFLIV